MLVRVFVPWPSQQSGYSRKFTALALLQDQCKDVFLTVQPRASTAKPDAITFPLPPLA